MRSVAPFSTFASVLAFLFGFHPAAAEAQLVTFKLTGTVASVTTGVLAKEGVASEEARLKFLARFPLSMQLEVTYTFEASTPDACWTPEVMKCTESTAVYLALRAVSVANLGDYAGPATAAGAIMVSNDIQTSGMGETEKGGESVDCSSYPALTDRYAAGASGLVGPAPVEGFSTFGFDLNFERRCDSDASGWLLNTDLPTGPPELGVQVVHAGLGLTWSDGTHWVQLRGPLTSLTLVSATNTGTGSNVALAPVVTLPDGTTGTVSMTFDNVEASGETTVTTSSGGAPPPSGFKLANPPVFYNITTTATFSGKVRVCLSWEDGQIANENNVSIFHYESDQWVDITEPTSRDPINNQVCGTTTSLSPFTLFEVKYPFTGFFSPVENAPTTNAVKAGAAVPVKFSLGGDLGLNIFATGFPRTQLMQCDTLAPVDEISETVAAGGSSLSYEPETARYTYVWKTDSAWGGSCRELQIQLMDGEVYTTRFTFRK